MLAEMTRCKQMACAYGDVEHVLKRVPGLDFDEWVARFACRFPSNKWDWIEGMLEERGIWKPKQAWGEGKVIIGSWQSNLLRMFQAQATKYNIPSLIITGAENTTRRREAKTQFQAPGGPRLFFLNTISGGTSLTLDAADDMIVVDETWVPDDQSQLEDRIHRVSRPDHQATYWYLRSRGTIEEQIARANLGADSLQRQLMDGRRGVQIARRLLTGG
jgi:SNF2 family DNA or RNA helicase